MTSRLARERVGVDATDDDRASYALARTRVDLRLAELRAALDRHEVSRRWQEQGFLEHLERALVDLAAEIPSSP